MFNNLSMFFLYIYYTPVVLTILVNLVLLPKFTVLYKLKETYDLISNEKDFFFF